jgi:hypothetical protein
MTQLKHLEIRYSTLTARGLDSVCKGCSNLEYMDLRGCISLTRSDINTNTSGLKNLTEIIKPDFNPPIAVLRVPRPGNPREE